MCAYRGFVTSYWAVDIAVTDVAFRSLMRPGGGGVCPSLTVKDRRGCLSTIYKLPVTRVKALGDFLIAS